MSDKIFLRLGPRVALGADDLQWILFKARKASPRPIDALGWSEDWKPVSFVRSTKAILERCIREKRLETTSTGLLALERLPPTFDAWKAARAAHIHALARVPEPVEPSEAAWIS